MIGEESLLVGGICEIFSKLKSKSEVLCSLNSMGFLVVLWLLDGEDGDSVIEIDSGAHGPDRSLCKEVDLCVDPEGSLS